MQNLETSRKDTNFLPHKDFVPPLENGDRLTREEFHRRYKAMPENIKAELINGVVYMSSPVRVKNHGKPHFRISGILFNYQTATPGIEATDNSTLKLDYDGEPQPDAMLWIGEEYGGNAFITDTDYLEGAPEFVVEISASTVSYDLHDKKDTYERNGIKEYVVWRVIDNEIDWFILENGKYDRLAADENGVIESRVFPGLRLNVKALLENNLQQVLADLQTGINSPEHREFVEILEKAKVK